MKLSPASKQWFPGVNSVSKYGERCATFVIIALVAAIVCWSAKFCNSPFDKCGLVIKPFLEGLINQSPTIARKFLGRG